MASRRATSAFASTSFARRFQKALPFLVLTSLLAPSGFRRRRRASETTFACGGFRRSSGKRILLRASGSRRVAWFNWESGATTPEIRYLPAIIEFLGYNPLPHGKTLAQRLLRHRSSLGLTRRGATAKVVGVDASTLARWERGERQPTGSALELVERFLKQSRPQNSPTRVA
jgi:DNA-binding XRE family transcriptional regulator